MKKRNGFVSTSSSSSFLVANKTGEDVTLREFLLKYEQGIRGFMASHKFLSENFEELVAAADELDIIFPAGDNSRGTFVTFSNETRNIADAFLRTFFDWQKPIDGDFIWSLEHNSQLDYE